MIFLVKNKAISGTLMDAIETLLRTVFESPVFRSAKFYH